MRPTMELEFEGEVVHWRGPSPFHFVPVPEDESDLITEISSMVTYGWGVIPVTARIGNTDYTTSLFPRNGGYMVPVKDVVRKGEGIGIGDTVAVRLVIDLSKVVP